MKPCIKNDRFLYWKLTVNVSELNKSIKCKTKNLTAKNQHVGHVSMCDVTEGKPLPSFVEGFLNILTYSLQEYDYFLFLTTKSPKS